MKKIGILGGSFDPIHEGHLYIAKAVKKQLALNEIWFMPTFQAPLKDDHAVSFGHRVNMIKLAIKPYRYMQVSTLEASLPTPSYTFNTVSLLKRKYPYLDFYWIIGDDQLASLESWHQHEALVKMVEFVVVSRAEKAIKTDFLKVEIKPHPASSTRIKAGDFTYLPYSVNQYINNNVLYYLDFLKNFISEKRYLHSLKVAEFAVKLARKYNVNLNQALLAGYLHDFGKEVPEATLYLYMQHYFPELLETPKSLWHSYVGSILVKEKFRVEDKDVLLAIKHHTDGQSKRLLSLIIYCADKVEDTRPYPVADLQELCLENINLGKEVIESIVLEKIKEQH